MRNKDFKIDNMIDDILTIWNEKLLKEWHPTKNNGLTPHDFIGKSNKRAVWICEKGHEWQAVIGTRSKGVGCPYCKGLLPTLETCLQTTFPELAEQWHPVKNGTITPYDVLPKSNKGYWRRCNKDHEWNNSPQKKN